MMKGQENIRPEWNMLDSYREGQVIFGRNREIDQLTDSIWANVQTIIYGKSGIGKTSMLQAGIYPRLRKLNFFPVLIRLSFYSGDYVSTVKECVIREAEREDETIGKMRLTPVMLDKELDVGSASLFQFFSKIKFVDSVGNAHIPVLIFDQFEEQINNKQNWGKTVDFLSRSLYELLEDNLVSRPPCNEFTNYRIVFSMREDYLYCLEDIVDKYSLTELKFNRFRIAAVKEQDAREIILKTFGVGALEQGCEQQIVDEIIRKSRTEGGFDDINTAILSFTASLLYKNAIDGVVHKTQLKDIDVYIQRYYSEACEQIGLDSALRLEEMLLTKDGHRRPVLKQELYEQDVLTDEKLAILEQNKIVRVVNGNDDRESLEYIHDIFAKVVLHKQTDKAKCLFSNASLMSGRSTRAELFQKLIKNVFYWLLVFGIMYVVFHWLCYEAGLVDQSSSLITFFVELVLCGSFVIFCSLSCLVPYFVRRIHDTGHSGLWLLFPPVALVMLLLPSTKSKYRGRYSLMVSDANSVGVSVGRNEYCVAALYEFYLLIVSVLVSILVVKILPAFSFVKLLMHYVGRPHWLNGALFISFPIWITCLVGISFLCMGWNFSAMKHRLVSLGYNLLLCGFPAIAIIICLIGKTKQKTNSIDFTKPVAPWFQVIKNSKYQLSDKCIMCFMVLQSCVPVAGGIILWLYALSYKSTNRVFYNTFGSMAIYGFLATTPFSFLYLGMRRLLRKKSPVPENILILSAVVNFLLTAILILIWMIVTRY